MNRKEKKEFDSIVVMACRSAQEAFQKAGRNDAEDLAQEVAIHLSAARLVEFKAGFTKEAVERRGKEISAQVLREARKRDCGAKLMDIENASSVPDVSTPHHFLAAVEIANAAVELDLDSYMMGDTLEDEAQHYGVSRQRAHQIINEKRDIMSEFLVD